MLAQWLRSSPAPLYHKPRPNLLKVHPLSLCICRDTYFQLHINVCIQMNMPLQKKNAVNFQQWKRPYVYRGVCRNLKRGFRSAAEGSEQSCVVPISPSEVRKKNFTVVFQLPGWALVAPSPLCTALPLLSGFLAIRDRVSLSTWEIMQAVIAHAYTNCKTTVCRLAAPAIGPRGDMLLQEI